MKRQILEQMRRWKSSERRKPLVLMGARQVGKTTSLRRFAETDYDNNVYLNFEDEPHLKSMFDSSIKPEYLLNAMKIEKGGIIQPERTLIIFDEIQACPNALNSLKYFNEDANEYHVATAGSLLGVKLLNTQGFPVGKVNFMDMYPLSFFEFLEVIGEGDLKNFLLGINQIESLPGNLHEKCLQYFRYYLYIGGMPEAVATYVETQALDSVREVHQAILRAYSLDFSKHAPAAQIMKINQVWNSLPNQLGKENKKFIYSVLRKGARAKEFETAIQWLKEAGLVHKIFNVSAPKIPLKAYANFEFFKLYLVDVGLLGAMANLSAKTLLQGKQLFQEFRGSYIENVVAQTLAQIQLQPYYWTSEGKAEVDFVFEHHGITYPIEVKSGTTNKKKSLQTYMQIYSTPLALRSSPMNLRKDNKILNCPLYLLGQVKQFLDMKEA